jgi:hypothetical protein
VPIYIWGKIGWNYAYVKIHNSNIFSELLFST